ncbi:MAG: hypothetical protein U0W40_07460 [Acidimicrobiia bacterium]
MSAADGACGTVERRLRNLEEVATVRELRERVGVGESAVTREPVVVVQHRELAAPPRAR